LDGIYELIEKNTFKEVAVACFKVLSDLPGGTEKTREAPGRPASRTKIFSKFPNITCNTNLLRLSTRIGKRLRRSRDIRFLKVSDNG
jgi:hypothetical protein